MIHSTSLPRLEDIERLSAKIRAYPAARREILNVAMLFGMDRKVIELLKEFPADEVFESPDDLVTRCSELELLINEEEDAPKEFLRSSID